MQKAIHSLFSTGLTDRKTEFFHGLRRHFLCGQGGSTVSEPVSGGGGTLLAAVPAGVGQGNGCWLIDV